jgi:hypothetical protein
VGISVCTGRGILRFLGLKGHDPVFVGIDGLNGQMGLKNQKVVV